MFTRCSLWSYAYTDLYTQRGAAYSDVLYSVQKKGEMSLHSIHAYSLTVRPSKAEQVQEKTQETQNEAPVEEP